MTPRGHKTGAFASLLVEGFFDPVSSTISYLVADLETSRCALVDTVLDYDASSGRTGRTSADQLIARVRELNLAVDWILESHVHADHLSAAPYLKSMLGGRIGIGAGITAVQRAFGAIYNLDAAGAQDGSEFDHLFADGEQFSIGGLAGTVMHTPGHTPACVSYLVGDGVQRAVFVGDTLFMPDSGTARCDFPGGDPHRLYRSIDRLLALPDDTVVYLCHDYPPGGRAPRFETTIGAQKAFNIHVAAGTQEDHFVAMRRARDARLRMPALMLPAVQVNMCAGRLPEPENNGVRYLRIPLNAM